MQHVFIAGAKGCFGRYLCAEYQRRGWYVIALVRRAAQTETIAADQLVEAQATDPATLKGIMAGADVVVSCLGIARPSDGADDWDVDVQANLNLLHEAEQAGVSRFAYIQELHPNTPSTAPKGAARSRVMAGLLRYRITAPVTTLRHARFVLGIVVLDKAGARNGMRNRTDHLECNLARPKTARIHHIHPERNYP